MIYVPVAQARGQLSALLDRVANGEEITITKRGRPVACLVSPQRHADDLVEWFRRERRGVRLGGLSVRELIEDGRHDRL